MSNAETARAEATGGAKAPPPRDARRTAAAILEVLAGACTPTEAAMVLGVSLPRYYTLETRALEGLVAACEPRSKGRGLSPERELDKLQRECDRLRKEGLRYQSLARTAQRAVGFVPPARPKEAAAGKGKRRHKPVVRALVAAARLKEAPVPSPGTSLPPALPAEPVHQLACGRPVGQPEGAASARASRP
jgi:hypothetical protein